MKVCPVCGTEYGDDAAFCSRDRSPLRPAAGEQAPGLSGQLIGERYQIDRRLGVGGMGEVYLARHVLMGRLCALKVMSPALSRDPDAVSRFNREATNASRIAHPNVCAIYDFGLTPDGLVYLAMEYVEGRALGALLEESGPLPVARASELLAQCARGLQAAHDLGIVHRDLKPDNIMVTVSGTRETAKLVDFGIAKAAGAEPGQHVTRTGFVVGTPDYMAPEQLSGDPLGGGTDQYALALVFYRAITGVLPFEGTSAQETLVKRLTDPPRPLAVARPGARFPAGLQGVMDRALDRDPTRRFPTVSAFSEAIARIVEADEAVTRRIPLPAHADAGVIPPTRVSGTRRPAGLRMAVVAGAVIVAGGGAWALFDGATSSLAPAPAPAPPPSPPTTQPQAPDTAAKGTDTTSRTVSSPPPAAPPPAAPTRQLSEAARVAAIDSAPADTLVPEPEQFDSIALRPGAIQRARRIMNSETQPARLRARAAASLAYAALTYRNDRAEALKLYRRAYFLFPTAGYASMIRQLQDSVPE